MKGLQFLLILILSIFLADVCMAGFIPKAFEGEFTQIKKKRRGVRKAPVKIMYAYPKNIRMEVTEHNIKTMYVCNPNTTWIYSSGLAGEPGQVRVGKSSKYCYSQIFDALNRGLKDNKLYTVKKENNLVYLLSFTKGAATRLGYDQVRIHFITTELNFKNINKLDLINKGKRSPVTLEKKSIKLLNKIDPKTFVFAIPAKTEVQQMK